MHGTLIRLVSKFLKFAYLLPNNNVRSRRKFGISTYRKSLGLTVTYVTKTTDQSEACISFKSMHIRVSPLSMERVDMKMNKNKSFTFTIGTVPMQGSINKLIGDDNGICESYNHHGLCLVPARYFYFTKHLLYLKVMGILKLYIKHHL